MCCANQGLSWAGNFKDPNYNGCGSDVCVAVCVWTWIQTVWGRHWYMYMYPCVHACCQTCENMLKYTFEVWAWGFVSLPWRHDFGVSCRQTRQNLISLWWCLKPVQTLHAAVCRDFCRRVFSFFVLYPEGCSNASICLLICPFVSPCLDSLFMSRLL